MSYRDPNVRACPACETALGLVGEAGKSFYRCPKCQGTWVSKVTLATMWGESGATRRVPPLLDRKAPPTRACPECEQPMTTGFLLRVPIDHCVNHGIWFDRRELEIALAGATLDEKDWLSVFVADLPDLK